MSVSDPLGEERRVWEVCFVLLTGIGGRKSGW